MKLMMNSVNYIEKRTCEILKRTLQRKNMERKTTEMLESNGISHDFILVKRRLLTEKFAELKNGN
jgi:hypothetical protein